MKIKKLVVEGMHNVTKKVYVFEDKTYLVGRNGSGKSTVLQAIQLALLGYIPATGKTKGSVCAHSPGSALRVVLTIDNDGQEIKVTRNFMTVKGSSTSETTIDPPTINLGDILKDLELPIFNFDEFLAMTANNQKDWFMKFLPSNGDGSAIAQTLMEEISKMNISEDALAYALSVLPASEDHVWNLPVSDMLSQLCTHFKSIQTAKKADSARLAGTINSLVRYDDVDGSLDDIESLNQEMLILQQDRDTIKDYMSKKAANDRVDALLDTIGNICPEGPDNDPEVIQHRAEIIKCDNALQTLDESIQELKADLKEIADRRGPIQSTVSKGDGVCPYSGAVCESVASKINEYKEQLKTLDEEYNEKYSVYQKVDQERKQVDRKRSLETIAIGAVLERYDRYYDVSKAKAVLPELPACGLDLDAVETKRRDIQDRIMKIGANDAYDKMHAQVTREKFICDTLLDVLKMLINLTGPNGLQTNYAEKPFIDLEADLNEYLLHFFGDSVKAKFILSNKSNSFSFGTYDSDTETYTPFSMLSSGEKCMYALALMSCIVSRSSSPLKLILVDDLFDHLDATNCKKVFEKVASINEIQYIIAGVVPCDVEEITQLAIR